MSEENFKIGLFYGSTTCYTEMAAEKIQQQMNDLFGFDCIDLYNIKDDGLHRTAQYDVLILGISTWDFGEIQEDWESQWQDIRELPLDGKIVAIFGLGDQMGYADWFQDALGMLHDEVVARQARIIGYWPNEGYDFTASKALTEDQSHFVGLSLDDENQYDLTDTRIAQWCQQLIDEMSDE